jgi:hypothetical protein
MRLARVETVESVDVRAWVFFLREGFLALGGVAVTTAVGVGVLDILTSLCDTILGCE